MLDLLAERADVSFSRAGGLGALCWTAGAVVAGAEVVFAKPRTYMNRSGRAGAALVESYGAAPEDLLVVHDDADIALGRIRIRGGGSAGGHNGLRSLIAALRTTEFPRVRLGVRGPAREDVDLVEYVLEAFENVEQDEADAMVASGAEAVAAVIGEGLVAAMNRFNGTKALADSPGAC